MHLGVGIGLGPKLRPAPPVQGMMPLFAQPEARSAPPQEQPNVFVLIWRRVTSWLR